MIRMVLRLLFGCWHPSRVRERVNGIPSYVCTSCGDVVPVIARQPDERLIHDGAISPLKAAPVTAAMRARKLADRAAKIRRIR